MVPESESTAATREGFPRITGYRVDGVIGRGATSVVYRAVQLAVDRPVALKVLLPELVGTKRAVQRLQREARTAARLAHPNIISAIDMGEVDGQWWYAMELVEGTPLSERLLQRGPLSEREALRLFIPLCEALQHAYEGGVVHRDIKPANILIDPRGRARLVDLGLAFSEDDPRVTAAGGTLGTPHYISPEQARDPSTADTRSDIWSLGATMYHAQCGRPPFEGESIAEILSSVLYHRIPDPRQVRPEMSKGMALVLRKCLARSPDRRYEQPLDLMDDLERILERRNPAVRASSLDPVHSDRPPWVRPTLLASGAAALALVAWLVGAEPWKEPSAAPNAESVTGWPRLERLQADFRAGLITHRRALHQLEEMRATIDGAYAIQRNRAQTEIEADLDRVLAGLVAEVNESFREALDAHEFPLARDLAATRLARQLSDRTGYREFISLPAKGMREEYKDWQLQLAGELEERRRLAVADAQGALHEHYQKVVRPEVAAALGENRWEDALERLRDAPSGWMQAHAAELRGLDDNERREVGESLAVEKHGDSSEVRTSWARVNAELVRWIDRTQDALARNLGAEAAQKSLSEKLAEEFREEIRRQGIERDQMPGGWSRDAFAHLDIACAELAQREKNYIEDRARVGFGLDEALTNRLCAQRRYPAAALHWQRRLDDDWRTSMGPSMDLRLRECQLLDELLSRAVEGVRARAGKTLQVYVGRIGQRGRVELGVDPLERGFDLVTPNRTLRLYFRDVARPASERQSSHVLHPEDVEMLAGMQRPLRDPRERLLKSLFRYYEADYRVAADTLPLGDLPEEPLVGDLRRRIDAAIQERTTLRAARVEELEALLLGIRSAVLAHGHSGSMSVLGDVHLALGEYADIMTVEQESELREIQAQHESLQEQPTLEEAFEPDELVHTPPLGVELAWRFEGDVAGAWQPGLWRSDGEGWKLRRPVHTDEQLLAAESAVRLELREPFDASQRITLALTFEIDEAERPSLLLVSVAGFHVAFVHDDKLGPRFLVDTSSAEDVLRRVRAGRSRSFEGFPGFGGPGPFELRLELKPKGGRLDQVVVNGRRMGARNQFGTPDLSDAGVRVIEIRATTPIRLREATLRGRRRPL